MTGTVKHARLESPSARSRLKRGRQPHWQALVDGKGLHCRRHPRWRAAFCRRDRRDRCTTAQACAPPLEKAIEDRVEIIKAKTRTLDSPYYQINPSGRVPYLIDDAGLRIEHSQLISAYLDSLDGKPRFHGPRSEPDWGYLRLEFMALSMCDGISVWSREMHRPASERSPTVRWPEASAWQMLLRVMWPTR